MNVADLTDVASALGWNLPQGWNIEGPAACDLQWQSGQGIGGSRATGKIELQGLTLHDQFLNHPITQLRGKVDLAGDSAGLAITSAQAFGGDWKGTIDVYPTSGERRFALSVDRLNAEDLDRWLNPQWRQGFLGNLLPFLNPSENAAADGLAARGTIAVEQFAFLRYVTHRLKGNLAIHSRHLELDNSETDFYGAHVSGKMVADLQKIPAYSVDIHFNELNLASLTAGAATLSRTFGGNATGDLSFNLSGVGRDALSTSLECAGLAEIVNPSIDGFDLVESLRSESLVAGTTSFAVATGAFKCANGRIEISRLGLSGSDGELFVSGSIDAARNLDFRLRSKGSFEPVSTEGSGDETRAYQLQGTLQSPRISRVQTTPGE